MSTRPWLPADEQHLVQVREAAGVDQLDLARRCLLSIGQIQELEGKGYGKQFYSEAIKFTAGTRVLTALGAQALAAPEPLTAQEQDISTTAVESAKTTSSAIPLPETAPSSKPEPMAPQAPGKPLPMLKLLALVLLAVVLIVATLYGTSGKKIQATPTKTPAPQPVQPPLEPPAPPAPAPASAPAPSAPSAPAAPVAVAAPKITPPAVKPAPADAAPTEFDCSNKFNTTKQVVYQPQTPPSKPGNYVYFVARSPSPVCVLDGSGKVLLYNLKPGQNKSHFGTPPFKVWHPDATIVVMYYRGWRVTGQAAQAGVTVLRP